MTNPHASDDSQWTVPDGQHQPDPGDGSMSVPVHSVGAGMNFFFEHWGVFKGDRHGFPVLCFNVSATDVTFGPVPDMDSHTLAVELPVSCPLLSITPAPRLHGLRRLVGMGGPRFGHDGFARRFQVETDDEDFAREVLTPEVSAWLLEHPIAAENPFRFEGSLLLMTNSGFMGPPETTGPKLDFLCELCTRLPASCWTADT